MTYLYGPGERRRREAREERREEGGEKEDRSLGENAIISNMKNLSRKKKSLLLWIFVSLCPWPCLGLRFASSPRISGRAPQDDLVAPTMKLAKAYQ